MLRFKGEERPVKRQKHRDQDKDDTNEQKSNHHQSNEDSSSRKRSRSQSRSASRERIQGNGRGGSRSPTYRSRDTQNDKYRDRDSDKKYRSRSTERSRSPRRRDPFEDKKDLVVKNSDTPKEEKKKKKEKRSKIAPTAEPMIIVTVNDRLGTKASIPCLASDPIKAFKALVAAQIGREPHEIMLKRQGERPFKDNLTLEDYGVSNGVQLDLEVDTGD